MDASHLPAWRGFNLLEKFTEKHQAEAKGGFRESDFATIAEWGFDFVRLPLSYRCWTRAGELFSPREEVLREIDAAVELGRQYRVHVCINFHRAPGYCVNPPPEPLDLWTDAAALDACAFHWALFAERYRGIPSEELSFNLLNEPGDVPEQTYARVVSRLVEAIREKDPARLVIADGLRWGTRPVPALAPLGIAQSTRGYTPMRVSHYRARWVKGAESWPEPTWPLDEGGGSPWDRERLRRECIEPWKALAGSGVGVHVGECGAFNATPHKVVLAWLGDLVSLWREAGWGWALWNLRGSFGVLDSARADVEYEEFRGHRLDRRMLEVLRGDE